MVADADFIILDARIDLKNWNKAVAQMEADARALSGKPILVDVKVNDSGLKTIQSQLNKIDTDITADVKFTTSGDDIANLREQWDDPLVAKVKFEQTGDDIVSLRDMFDDTINADVKFNQTGDDIAGMLDNLTDVTVDVKANEDASVDTTISSVEKKLDELKTLAKIELILNAAEFIKGVEALPLVGALVEIEELSHKVVGQTGRDFEGAGRTINNIWTGNWGDSKEEIAGVVTQVLQLRGATGDFLVESKNVENVAVGAFQAAAVGGKEATETLRAATQLVKNGFVPSFQEAFDLISLGFAQGLDQNGDYLDTLVEYSSTFPQLGITANGFFNILKSGTESGVFNTDKIADSFKEMLNLTNEEIAAYQKFGDETDRTKALAEAGLMDEATAYAAGEMSGDEFSQAVIDTLIAKFEDPAEQQRLAKAIFSPTMVEDAGLPNLLQTDFQNKNIWKGQAKLLSDEIFSGPGSAFQTMQRTLETHFLNALINSVEAQEFMDKITKAAQRFGTELASGASIGEALEVALEMPGLNDQIAQLESVLGNFIIDFIGALADVGQALGADVSGLREAVSRYGAGQLTFDIQTAKTEDDFAAAIQRAVERGVSSSEISNALATGVNEVLQGGDVAKAESILNAINSLPKAELGEKATAVLQAAGNDVDLAVEALQKARDELSGNLLQAATPAGAAQLQAIDEAIGQLQTRFVNLDTQQMQGQINTFVAQLNKDLQDAVSSGDFNLAQSLGEQLGIQNIDQFISQQKAQSTIDALFPKPSQADLDRYLADNFLGLQNALLSGDYAAGASFAEKLMDTENPTVQAAVDDFATTLMIQFNNALAIGDTETATDVLTILGLSPESNQLAIDSMSNRLQAFSEDGVYQVDQVTSSFEDMGTGMEKSTNTGVTGVDNLYGAILSDRGVLGIGRLDSLAKRFDAVASALKGALDEIKNAENKVGSGVIEGAAVGGLHGPGVFMTGETGRELVSTDTRLGILNNQTTERLYTALQNMAGVTNNTSNQRTINYAPTIYVQNQAQAALFGGQSLDQLRGEAF